MNIRICTAKLHNVTVTEANPKYKGSITIGCELMKAAGILPYQMVIINNGRNGVSWQTYVIPGKEGEVCLNGLPPSHHFKKGDKIIVLVEAFVTPKEYKKIVAGVVFVDRDNKILEIKKERLSDLC